MKKPLPLRKIIIILGIIATLGFTSPGTPLNKLDTWNYIQFDKIVQAGQLDLLKECDDRLSVILTVTSIPEATKIFSGLGIKPRSISGNIVTAEIPLARLQEILDNNIIVSLKFCERNHNPVVALPAPSAKTVIGIVDTGLVLHYDDYLDTYGKSRIMAIWDQTRPGMSGPYLAGATSGRLYTGEEIEWYLTQREKSQTPGHGAIVTAIAASNKAVKTHEDMAADLEKSNNPILVVETTKDEGDMIDAVAFIKAQCVAWHLPGVVNLSYGKHNGPHDGTSILAQALTNMVATDFLIVVSAGNEGQSNIYAHGETQSSTVIDFTTASIGEKTNTAKGIAIYGWYDKNQQGAISLLSPSGQKYGPVNTGQWQEWATSYGDVVIANGISDSPGKTKEIQVVIQNTKASAIIPDGVWRFNLDAKKKWDTDFWLVSNPGYSFKFNAVPDPEAISISDIATGDKLITVGGYIFDSKNRQIMVSDESGKGPARDQSQKPDMLAPWSVLVLKQNQIVPAAGTSFSAPLVARLISVIWGRDPSISGETLRSYFKNKALMLEPGKYLQPKNSGQTSFTMISWDDCEKAFTPVLSNK